MFMPILSAFVITGFYGALCRLVSKLEKFSITSIDPLIDNWIISMETSDGIITQAQAMKDIPFNNLSIQGNLNNHQGKCF